MITRRSDTGVSRISTLFTLVGVLIVSSVVSLVLVTADHGKKDSDRAAAAPRVSTTAPDAGTTAPVPSPSPTPSESTSPVAKTSAVPKVAATTGETPAARGPITYTVKKGDNLTVIAAWFKLHGYGDLYDANRAVIGADPNLIRPGQRITVSSDGMTVSK